MPEDSSIPGPAPPSCSRANRRHASDSVLRAEVQAAELVPRADTELRIRLVKVISDGARAEEQLGSDLAVGSAQRGQPDDLEFLRGEPAD